MGKITKTFLLEHYVGQQKSISCIANENDWSYRGISLALKRNGIERRKEKLGPIPKPLENLVGKKFGKHLVTRYLEPGKYGSHIWECQCECGNVNALNSKTLRDKENSNEGCRSCRLKHCDELHLRYFNNLKLKAQSRGYSFDITPEYLCELFLQQERKCALSGLPIILARNYRDYKNQSASVDRINSSIGYEPGNVQWVHKDVNRIKQNLKQEYFLELCRRITHKRKSC